MMSSFCLFFNVPSLATTLYLSTRVAKTCSASQSKFKVLTIKLQSLPTHFGMFWHHSTNTWREAKSISITFGHFAIFVFGVLKIRMNETPVFHLDAYSILHRKTLTHILPFGRCKLCDFFHDIFNTTALTGISKRESCVFYLDRGFFKFFSFSVCFLTFILKFLLLFLNEPFTRDVSNLHLLVEEEMSLVFGTRYSP